MKTAGLPFSGKYGFVSTEMSWPITHMVAPKGDALRCAQCHADQGRLEGIAGVYMPGRDRHHLLDMAGWTIVAAQPARRPDPWRHPALHLTSSEGIRS